jgi:hypothetical protein
MATKIRHHQVNVTPAAFKAMEDSGQEWDFFLALHFGGISSDEDHQRNVEARNRGGALVNSYRTLKGRELLIMTDVEQGQTTILLPTER